MKKQKNIFWIMGVVLTLTAFTLAACGSGGGGGGVGNSAPVANAGPDQNVTTGSLVTLDGSGSTDADGDTLTYFWSFTTVPGGSNVTDADLSDATAVNPTFTPDLDGSYVVQLIINDGTVDSTPDAVTITAATGNSAPVANAGPDQNVTTGSLVTLDGTGSTDADGDSLAYSWSFVSKPEGSAATLSNATLVYPTFTVDRAGSYVVRLVVNDGTVDSAPDTVTITVSAIRLAKTGQTTSYASGDDGVLQKGVAWPDPRFTVGAGAEVDCVTDNLTGLMWVKEPDATTRTWQAALDHANGLTLCGHADWRLPNRKELRSLANYGEANSATWLNTKGFSNVQAVNYWSSTTYAGNTTRAWYVYMYGGFVDYVDKTHSYYVWPVRSGQ